VHFVVFYVII